MATSTNPAQSGGIAAQRYLWRRAVLAAGLIGLVLVTAGLLRARQVAQRIEIAMVSGLAVPGLGDVRFGAVAVELLPNPRLHIAQISATLPALGVPVLARDVTVSLAPGLLLLGRLDPVSVTARSLTIDLPDDVVPATGFQLSGTQIARILRDLAGEAPAIVPRLTVQTLAVRCVPEGGDLVRLSQATLFARTPDEPIRIAASGLYVRGAGQPLTALALTLPGRAEIASGRQSRIKIEAAGPGHSVAFSGIGAVSPALSLSGRLDVRAPLKVLAPAIARLVGDGGSMANEGAPAGPHGAELGVLLGARMEFDGKGLRLEDLAVSAGELVLDGVASMRHDGQRWAVSGTLAGKTLSLPGGTEGYGGLAHGLSDALRGAISLDVRLSARRFNLGRLAIDEGALSLFVRPERAEVTLISGLAHQGRVKGKVTTQTRDGELETRIAAQADQAEIGNILGDLVGTRPLTGTGSLSLALDIIETSAGARRVDGRLAASARNGEWIGFDLDHWLTQERGEGDDARLEIITPLARTKFEHASGTALFRNRSIMLTDLTLGSTRQIATGSGHVNLDTGALALELRVQPSESSPQRNRPRDIRIEGPLVPAMMPPPPGLGHPAPGVIERRS